MGALVGNVCFETPASAADAVWSAVAPVISSGSPPIVTMVEWTGTAWQYASYQSGVVLAVQGVPALASASCSNMDNALDGMALGWLVVGCWAIAWGINIMRRALGWGW